MANQVNSVLANAILLANARFQELEKRQPSYGELRAFMANREVNPLNPRIASSEQKPYSIRLDLHNPTTAGTDITCDPTAVSGDSQDSVIEWTTAVGNLVISPMRATNNLKTVEQMAAQDMYNMWSGIYQKMALDAYTWINTNRSQNDITSGLTTWKPSTDFYNEVANADKDVMRDYIESEMRDALYNNELMLLYSSPYDAIFKRTDLQGTGNSTNLEEQTNFMNFRTYNKSAVSGTFGSVFAIPFGGIQMITWIDPTYRGGLNTNADKGKFSLKDNLFGLDFGGYMKKDCADTTAIGGGKQDIVESYQFHINYGFVHAEVSTPATETVIHKYALKTS